eukprot:6183783-Pleurochrysis_carterae.AAC.1
MFELQKPSEISSNAKVPRKTKTLRAEADSSSFILPRLADVSIIANDLKTNEPSPAAPTRLFVGKVRLIPTAKLSEVK